MYFLPPQFSYLIHKSYTHTHADILLRSSLHLKLSFFRQEVRSISVFNTLGNVFQWGNLCHQKGTVAVSLCPTHLVKAAHECPFRRSLCFCFAAKRSTHCVFLDLLPFLPYPKLLQSAREAQTSSLFDLSVARTVFSEAICQLHASTSSYTSGNCQEQSSSVTISEHDSEQGREESQASTTDMPALYNADQNRVTFIP